MKQIYLNIMKWFLPVLFISYMAGITLFTHSHVVNGVTIVHSHPFKKGGEHSHTTVEFQLIHILDHTLLTDNGLTPLFLSCLFYVFFSPLRSVCGIVVPVRAPFLSERLLSFSLHHVEAGRSSLETAVASHPYYF